MGLLKVGIVWKRVKRQTPTLKPHLGMLSANNFNLNKSQFIFSSGKDFENCTCIGVLASQRNLTLVTLE